MNNPNLATKITFTIYRNEEDQLRVKMETANGTHDYGINDNGDGFYGESIELQKQMLALVANLNYKFLCEVNHE